MSEPTAKRTGEDLIEPGTVPEDGADLDVEGHNLLSAELGQTVTQERRREAKKIEDAGRRHRELAPHRSLRDRLFGR